MPMNIFDTTNYFMQAGNNLILALFLDGMSLAGVHVQEPVEKVSKHARLYAAKKCPEENTKRYPTQSAAEQNRLIPNHKTATR